MSGVTQQDDLSTLGEKYDVSTRLSRTPRPYSHTKPPNSSALGARTSEYLPSPALTPPSFDAERPYATKFGRSSDDSGTEADDEALAFTKALPAPNTKPRKGLKLLLEGPLADLTPFLTPSQLNEEAQTASRGYFGQNPEDDAKCQKEKFTRRRRAELIRRGCELALFALIGILVLNNHSSRNEDGLNEAEQYGSSRAAFSAALFGEVVIILSVVALYPVRLFLWPRMSEDRSRSGLFRIPATFDPAPVLYPSFLPVLIAASLSTSTGSAAFTNVALGLSTLPSQLIPTFGSTDIYNSIHWVLTLAPMLVSRPLLVGGSYPILHPEVIVLLFPLHKTLLAILQKLTTTSLLSSEVQLLSVGLVNVLLFSESPQSTILMILLWIGGTGLLLLCGPVLRWNVALERIPSWRFRRGDQFNAPRTSIFAKTIQRMRSKNQDAIDSGEEDDQSPSLVTRTTSLNGSSKGVNASANGPMPRSQLTKSLVIDTRNTEIAPTETFEYDASLDLKRNETAPSPSGYPTSTTSTKGRKRSLSMSAQAYLSLTTFEVEFRKWSYAIYTYIVTIFLILVPIRMVIATESLQNSDPFGWAIGYLFGDIPAIRNFVSAQQLGNWIHIPSVTKQINKLIAIDSGLIPSIQARYGLSNTRLTLFAYWALVVALGISMVLHLSSVADVDTRRKVFHGMMVIMLLPTTYIDPCFLSLALILVLAVFLLLELFRATQLRPLSKPLAQFLTPYVDGRDLRGPVVVSHLFLLIGCAIPFWLSLADVLRKGDGWEVVTRDVSMVAGVICVGMGDAAASLIGRRYGKTKWPWAGGKSLEGSAAFAAAVTVGLLVGKAWLSLGGWSKLKLSGEDTWMWGIGKACLAATGASFTEAVLTGANDNVVVPIILWLMVKGVGF